MNPNNKTAAAPRHTITTDPNNLQPSAESAKNTGTPDSPDTDAGLGSPNSSSPRPVHEAGPDATPSAGHRSGPDAPLQHHGQPRRQRQRAHRHGRQRALK